MIRHVLWLWLSLSAPLIAGGSFFLPDEADDALHRLKKLIASAAEELIIITPQLDGKVWERPLADAVRRGVKVTLVTAEQQTDAGAALVRFKRVDYRTVTGLKSSDYDGTLAMSLAISDGHSACSSSHPLTRSHFEHDLGTLECRNDTEAVRHYRSVAERIIARAHSYLEE